MIRILHSVSYLNRGGIETMLMNYYRRIDRSKVQFDFLCNSYSKGAYDDEVISLGGRIFRTPGFNPLKHFAYKKYMQQLFYDHPEYKIIEAHNGPLGRFALKSAKDNRIPIRIYHAHGADLPFDLKWPIKYYCMKTLKYSMTHHFACGIKAGEFYYGKKIMDSGDYVIIPNAIEINRFTYSEEVRNNIRTEYNLNDKQVIGLVGNFVKAKNHKFLIEVFAQVHKQNPDAVLVLLGGGIFFNDIKKLVASKSLQDYVIFTGAVSNANDWYQAFDIFVMPSLWEGLPVVGVEAQAADLPCIFSTAVTNEIKVDDTTQFFDLKMPADEWAKKINDILHNLPERKNNYQLITDHNYNIETEAVKLQNLYIDLYNSIK